MPDVDVFLHDGFPRVWPPVVAVGGQDTKISFFNATGADMKVVLTGVPLPEGVPKEVTVKKGGPVKDVAVDTTKAQGRTFEYDVLCGPAGLARGLSHPIIIIR